MRTFFRFVFLLVSLVTWIVLGCFLTPAAPERRASRVPDRSFLIGFIIYNQLRLAPAPGELNPLGRYINPHDMAKLK